MVFGSTRVACTTLCHPSYLGFEVCFPPNLLPHLSPDVYKCMCMFAVVCVCVLVLGAD